MAFLSMHSTFLFLQKGKALRVVWLLALLLIPSFPALAKEGVPSTKVLVDPAAGKAVYEENCARCHGALGLGDGPDARHMFPKPRIFADGVYKFRTTASGTPPTDDDLFRTISTGLPGSRMPGFERLPEDNRWQLVYYVKSLAKNARNQKPEPLDLGKDPGAVSVNVTKGKQLYAQLGCAACHGNAGHGNGPSAPTLKDNWGNPIRSADLTQGWRYRGGATPRDIVARMMASIDGAPMPSYADAFSSKEDAWNLAYYVQSIQEKPHFNRVIEALKARETLPTKIDDPRWEKVPLTHIRVGSLLYKNGEIEPSSISTVAVQAVYNEKEILFRFSWHDPSENRQTGTPADAFGLVLLGDRPSKFQIGSLRNWSTLADAPALDFTYWSADRTDLLEGVVKGVEGLLSGGHGVARLESEASYNDGVWTLLMKRPLQSPVAAGTTLKINKQILLGIMVWNGGNDEHDRRRANSNWIDFVLQA